MADLPAVPASWAAKSTPTPGVKAEKYPLWPLGSPSPCHGPISARVEPYNCSMEKDQLKYKNRSWKAQAWPFLVDGIVSRPIGTFVGFLPLRVHRLSSLKM